MLESNATELFEFVYTTQEITCFRCESRDVVKNVDDYEAANRFTKDGWQTDGIEAYCPQCSKELKEIFQLNSTIK